jgi:6-pyruvoyltetrahydropterin/6-carboxytetrahydropterin synthase
MFLISVKGEFAAAHSLPSLDEAIHGHTWRVRATVKVESLNQYGIGFDFRDLRRVLSGILKDLDHKYLNELEPFGRNPPTAENLASWIYQELSRRVAVPIDSVAVAEATDAWATYTPDG